MRDTVSSLLVGAALAAPLALLPPAEAGPPAQLALARYVALGYDRGDRFVSVTDVRTDFLPEERAALQTIRAEIERWERYVVVDRPGQADLLIAVRKGRLVSVGGGVRTGVPGSVSGIGGGVQVSSPDDMIEVFDAKDGSLIWRVMRPNGLDGAGPPLFDEFRAQVAKADKVTTKP